MYIRLFFLMFFLSCTTNPDYPKSDHYSPEKNQFYNPTVKESRKGFMDFIHWKFFTTPEKWPKFVPLEITPNLGTSLKPKQVNVTFVNHSTFLLQFNGINILTDPVWSDRVSPVSWFGPKRVHKPGIKFRDLPKIDIVLISHNHYDHLDKETLSKLEDKYSPIFLCPLGDAKLLQEIGINKAFELDWWKTLVFNDMEITFTPTQHWSRRTLLDTNRSLWGGYVIKFNSMTTYFAGDTGYSPHFKEIKKRLGGMNLSLLPIGAYSPRWFMQTMHMDPEEAIWAHKDLDSKKSIGIHHGTFQLTNEKRDEPSYKLRMYLRSNQLTKNDFLVLKPGESRIIDL